MRGGKKEEGEEARDVSGFGGSGWRMQGGSGGKTNLLIHLDNQPEAGNRASIICNPFEQQEISDAPRLIQHNIVVRHTYASWNEQQAEEWDSRVEDLDAIFFDQYGVGG